ncbi:MAG: energy transducer TonB [Pseudomonadota bacterium]
MKRALFLSVFAAACASDDGPSINTDTAIPPEEPFTISPEPGSLGSAPTRSAERPPLPVRTQKVEATCRPAAADYLPGPVTVRDRSRLRDPRPQSRPVEALPPSMGLFRGYSSVCITVSFDVDPDGTTARAAILYAVPSGAAVAPFESAAVSAVRRWRYEPGTLDGRKVIYPKNTAYVVFRDDGTASAR